MSLWYFAYGSNMCPSTFLERRALKPLASHRGWVDGLRLCRVVGRRLLEAADAHLVLGVRFAEAAVEGRNARFVEPGDAEGLAREMIDMARCPHLAHIGAESRARKHEAE